VEFAETLSVSRTFYREHNLSSWAAALPKKPRLATGADDVLAYADRCGFDFGFAFPPFSIQYGDLDKVIEETLRKRAPGLADDNQYSQAYISDNWDKIPNEKVVQRTGELGPRMEGAYILLMSRSADKAVFTKNGKQMVSHLESKNWTGLTVLEYLVLQRYFCELYKDHRFFATPLDESCMHWLWLTDSATDASCAAAVGSSRGSMLYGCKIGTRDARRGAVPTLIAPLA